MICVHPKIHFLLDRIQKLPDENYAAGIVRRFFDEPAVKVERFTTGLCHFVYDVETESGKSFVVRIARRENRAMLAGALYWYRRLKPAGVPLAEIIYAAVDGAEEFPFLILERLAGEDLGIVYRQLSKEEKKKLAGKMVGIQNIVGALPFGKGFGFVDGYESGLFREKWIDVLFASLERSRKRMQAVGIGEERIVERAAKKFGKFESYFSRIEPRAFLDDITTKNVIVDKGGLSGIVDVDHVCFGDNLFTVALTQMSLLRTKFDLDYIDFWCAAAQATDEQRSVLQLYTAIFCADFMSELGQIFNRETAQSASAEEIQMLTETSDELLAQV